MERHFDLIKSDYKTVEKRILPRFPFSYLIFKANGKVFEIKDISFTGMQLCLKDGGHDYSADTKISGDICWRGNILAINGLVKWAKGKRLGLRFDKIESLKSEIENFLSVENIIAGLRPLHEENIGLELPPNLKYWLRADAPFEVFVWQHSDGEFSKFQIIMMNRFVEWQDGVGIKTGQILKFRDHDTPLMAEDEIMFEIDESISIEYVDLVLKIIENVPLEYWDVDAIDFLKTKLSYN